MLALRAFEHFILSVIGISGKMSHIGNIHHPRHIVAKIVQRSYQHILHNIGTKVADMSKMINRRTAGIHFHFPRFVCYKLILASGQRIIQFHFYFLRFPSRKVFFRVNLSYAAVCTAPERRDRVYAPDQDQFFYYWF